MGGGEGLDGAAVAVGLGCGAGGEELGGGWGREAEPEDAEGCEEGVGGGHRGDEGAGEAVGAVGADEDVSGKRGSVEAVGRDGFLGCGYGRDLFVGVEGGLGVGGEGREEEGGEVVARDDARVEAVTVRVLVRLASGRTRGRRV